MFMLSTEVKCVEPNHLKSAHLYIVNAQLLCHYYVEGYQKYQFTLIDERIQRARYVSVKRTEAVERKHISTD